MVTFIGLHITNSGIVSSNGDIIKEPPFLDYLLNCYPVHQKVLFDLDASAASLFHLIKLTKEQSKQLLKDGKLYIEGYKIVYFPKYFLAISYGSWQGHPEITFANMNQDGYLKPIYTEDNSIEDTIKKATEARNTAIKVSNAFEYFSLDSDSISSPIKAFLNQFELDWPTADDCPDNITELAWEGIRGHWFEVFKMGSFNASTFDLNGSYCYELSTLPDIRKGKFIESKEVPANARLGIAKGILETEAEFHPFLTRIDKNNYTPTGRIPNILGLRAIKLLHQYKELGIFKIDNGYWWIPTTLHYCYKPRMLWLWDKKQKADNATKKSIATRLYSATWGIQSQYLPKTNAFGKYFNSFINFTVEEGSRMHVAETCLQNKVIPLAIVGDGFITDKELNITNNNGTLGGWKLSKQGKCLIAGNGNIVFESSESPRGLALHYNTLLQQMKSNPKANRYTRTKYSPVTLMLAITRDFTKLGTVQKVERVLDIHGSLSRMFPVRPTTGKDLLNGKTYHSLPWDYSILNTVKAT